MLSSFCFSCKQADNKIEKLPIKQQRVIEEIEERVWEFHTADSSRDAEKVIELMWPESTLLIDGKEMAYEDMATGARNFMPSLQLFHTVWTDLTITSESPLNAKSSFHFRDSIITQEGFLTESQGPNTFFWENRNGVWKIIHVEASHYPLDQ